MMMKNKSGDNKSHTPHSLYQRVNQVYQTTVHHASRHARNGADAMRTGAIRATHKVHGWKESVKDTMHARHGPDWLKVHLEDSLTFSSIITAVAVPMDVNVFHIDAGTSLAMRVTSVAGFFALFGTVMEIGNEVIYEHFALDQKPAWVARSVAFGYYSTFSLIGSIGATYLSSLAEGTHPGFSDVFKTSIKLTCSPLLAYATISGLRLIHAYRELWGVKPALKPDETPVFSPFYEYIKDLQPRTRRLIAGVTTGALLFGSLSWYGADTLKNEARKTIAPYVIRAPEKHNP